MIRCIKSHTEGEYFYTPIAATHVVEGHIYETSDRANGQIRTSAGWHPEECFEDRDKELIRKFKPRDKVKCVKDYCYFDYYKGFRITKGMVYTVRDVNAKPEELNDYSKNIDDSYSYHFLLGLVEDYSNIGNEPYYPEHYFELVVASESRIGKILMPKSSDEIEEQLKVLEPTEMLRAAASSGRMDYVKLSLEHGANVDECNDENGDYPIELAIQYNHIQIVYFLLNCGADVTNMSLVFSFGNVNLFIFLLDHIEKYQSDMLNEVNLGLALGIADEDKRYDRLEMIRARIRAAS